MFPHVLPLLLGGYYLCYIDPIVSLDFRPKVGPWNAMVSSPQIGGLAERMGGSAGIGSASVVPVWGFRV